MAEIINKNYHRQLPDDFKNGSVIRNCNVSQQEPNTAIGVNITGLSFISCNLMNCKVPKDAKIESCLIVQKEIIPEPEPTQNELANMELKMIQERYGDIAKTEVEKVFNLKTGII